MWDFHRLLGIARERYDVVVVDLRDVVDEVATAVIRDADRLYIVTTPEPASLSLIQRRLRELEHEGIRVDHIEFVLNRQTADDDPVRELSAAIRHNFTVVIPEDSPSVKEAARRCRLVAPKSAFRREAVALARTFLEMTEPGTVPAPRPSRSIRKLVTNALGL